MWLPHGSDHYFRFRIPLYVFDPFLPTPISLLGDNSCHTQLCGEFAIMRSRA